MAAPLAARINRIDDVILPDLEQHLAKPTGVSR
jgi:hypothetical protein